MIRMKVRASVKKMSDDDIIVWRKSRGGKKAKLFVINKNGKNGHKQRQG